MILAGFFPRRDPDPGPANRWFMVFEREREVDCMHELSLGLLAGARVRLVKRVVLLCLCRFPTILII